MASFLDQAQYYRELANAYAATMLENIAFYKAMMLNQIGTIMMSTKEYVGYMIANMGKNRELIVAKVKLFYSWTKEMVAIGIQKGIAGFQYAFSSALYYAKEFPGWVINSSIWLYKKFIQGFILGYDLLCKLSNLLIDLTSALYNVAKHLAIKTLDALWHMVVNFPYYLQKTWDFVSALASGLKDLTVALMKASWAKIVQLAKVFWDVIKQVPYYLHKIWGVAIKIATTLKDVAKEFAIEAFKYTIIKISQALNALLQFALNLPHYLAQGWQLAVQFIQWIPYYLSQGWQLAVAGFKNMVSTMIDFASKAINHVLPIMKAFAHKAFSKIAMGLGMTFGICAAIVDLLFEGIGFVVQNTIGHLLPNLGALAAILAPIKAGLALGLVGLGGYGAFIVGKKLYNFAKTLFAADAPQPVIAANPVVVKQQPAEVANIAVAQPQAQIVPLFNAQRAQANNPAQDAQAMQSQVRRSARLNAAAAT